MRQDELPISFLVGVGCSPNRLLKNRQNCHPEEPQAVLSETKEGSPHLPDSRNAEILRFAQNDSAYEFFSSLLGY